MTATRLTSLALVSLLTLSGAYAATLDSARDLYASGDVEAARSELAELLDSSDDDATRADALNLLGTIAVEQQEWDGAYEAWGTLLADYPDSDAAGEARTKLTLVTALMDAQGQKPVAPPSPQPPAPAATPEAAPAAPSPPAAPAPTAAPAAPAAPAPEPGDLVLVAGRGRPYDAVEDSTKRVLAWLLEQGVDAESATTGVAVVQDSDVVLAQLLEVVRARGAGSLLYLHARYNNAPEVVRYSLYQPDGSVLWTTKVTGGTGFTGEPYTKSGIKEKLFERSLEKLAKKVGGPGLPVE